MPAAARRSPTRPSRRCRAAATRRTPRSSAANGLNALAAAFPALTEMTAAEPLGLSYTTRAARAADVLAAGPASLELRLSSTAPETGIWAVISDVSPDGTPTRSPAGACSTDYPGRRPRRDRCTDPRTGEIVQPYGRYDRRDPAALGQERLYRVEFWPIGNRFKAGHRIRLDILGSSGGIAARRARRSTRSASAARTARVCCSRCCRAATSAARFAARAAPRHAGRCGAPGPQPVPNDARHDAADSVVCDLPARAGFSELMVTVIFATYAAGVIAALLLFGPLSDQIGRRRALQPGLALSALSAVAFLLADEVGLLLVGRVLSGQSRRASSSSPTWRSRCPWWGWG